MALAWKAGWVNSPQGFESPILRHIFLDAQQAVVEGPGSLLRVCDVDQVGTCYVTPTGARQHSHEEPSCSSRINRRRRSPAHGVGPMAENTDRSLAAGTNRLDTEDSSGDSSGAHVKHTDSELTHETRRDIVDREKEQHGGLKMGSAFFGWLTATGMAILLTAFAAAAGTAVGVATDTTLGEAAGTTTQQADTIGWVGGATLLVILFVAYYCGGYVAGRMARFDGLKQGLGVWIWALVIAGAVALVGAIAGAEYNILERLNSFPRLPVGEGTVTTAGLIALLAVVVVTLVGALLGGLAGMRFHRQVDKTGLGQ